MKKTLLATSMVLASLLHAEQIQSIKYINLSSVSTSIANDTLDLQVGDQLDIKKINKAIKEFYRFGYFDDIQVTNEKGNLELVFTEKPIIASIDMIGYKTREEDKKNIFKAMRLAKGNMFTTEKVKQAKKDLLDLLEKEGFVNSVVEVDVENINENSVALVFNVNKGLEILIKEVNYHGAENLDAGDFEEVTANNEEDYFSWWFGQDNGEAKLDQLEYDVFRIQDQYFQKGYLDAKVKDPFMKVDFATNKASLDYFITEGQQYSITDIKIYLDSTILDPETLYSELKLQKDRVFNLEKLRKDVKFIKTQVADLGYAFTQVKHDLKKNIENGTVDVIFNVIPGKKVYINDVLISGNGRTLDRVIRRNVYLAPGDLFNLTDFDDSKKKLKRLGFFSDVSIEQKRVSEDKMDLIVKVEEDATGTIVLGGGYGSYDGMLITVKVNEKNVFGSGKSVGASVDTSEKRHNYKLSYTDPAINDSVYNMTVEIHNAEDEYDYSSPDYTLDKIRNGFSVSLGREIFRDAYIGSTYRLDFIEEKYTDDSSTDGDNIKVNGDGPSGNDYYKVDEDYVSSSITPYINYNSTDDFYFPRSGIKAGTSLEFAGVGGDSKYLKSKSYFKYYHGLEDSWDWDAVLRYRAQVNLLEDNGKLTQGDSFYLGGTKTVRGYKSYAFGPDGKNNSDIVYKQMFANSIELSMPLIPKSKMRWGVFYDYGMIGKDSFSDIKRAGTGAMLEWISPFGPMQFIFAQPVDDKPGDKTSSFEFSLGGSF